MGVAFYRKKPVTIEAIQLVKGNDKTVLDWINRNDGQAIPIRNSPAKASRLTGSILIHTLNGDHVVEPSEWIIRGVRGEFYPCRADIFAETHEPDPDA